MANAGPVIGIEGPQVRLLGGFRASYDGRVVHLPAVQQRLVAFLALSNRTMARVEVAGRLWPDVRDQRALANLRSALWRLRQPDCTFAVATPTEVALCPGVTVDVHHLDLPEGDIPSPLGDVLPGWGEEWVITARERLRQLRLHALEARGEQLLRAGQAAAALDLARAAVGSAPDRESAQRVLIAAHVAQGERTEALRHYRAYRSRLADAYGGEPSPAMTELMAPLAAAGPAGGGV